MHSHRSAYENGAARTPFTVTHDHPGGNQPHEHAQDWSVVPIPAFARHNS